MHRKSDVGGGIASVTIQTDTPKPRQVVAAPDSGGWGGWGGERERGMHRGRKRARRRRDDYKRIRGM